MEPALCHCAGRTWVQVGGWIVPADRGAEPRRAEGRGESQGGSRRVAGDARVRAAAAAAATTSDRRRWWYPRVPAEGLKGAARFLRHMRGAITSSALRGVTEAISPHAGHSGSRHRPPKTCHMSQTETALILENSSSSGAARPSSGT